MKDELKYKILKDQDFGLNDIKGIGMPFFLAITYGICLYLGPNFNLLKYFSLIVFWIIIVAEILYLFVNKEKEEFKKYDLIIKKLKENKKYDVTIDVS